MTTKNLIGYILFGLIVMALFLIAAISIGWVNALIIYLAMALFVGLGYLIVYLITN